MGAHQGQGYIQMRIGVPEIEGKTRKNQFQWYRHVRRCLEDAQIRKWLGIQVYNRFWKKSGEAEDVLDGGHQK